MDNYLQALKKYCIKILNQLKCPYVNYRTLTGRELKRGDILSSSGLQKKWASKGSTEDAAKTFTKIREIIDEVAKSSNLEEVTQKIASISASTLRNYIQVNGPQRGRISAFTCQNLSQYCGVPFDVFAGKEPFSEEYQKMFRKALIRDFSPESKHTSQQQALPKKDEFDFKGMTVSELLDYFSDIVAAKVVEKLQQN